MPAATSTGADTGNNGTAKSRDHNQGNQDRKYTVEQKTAVLRVRKCSPTAFYDILGLESVKATVTEAEIKKAYRKLSLLTHPDKNGHEHADEAFKMVSRAFGVLGDADKKAKFDRFGVIQIADLEVVHHSRARSPGLHRARRAPEQVALVDRECGKMRSLQKRCSIGSLEVVWEGSLGNLEVSVQPKILYLR